MPIVIVLLCLVIVFPNYLAAQDKKNKADTSTTEHSISKAAIFSAVLPGLGQVYNKKAWKVPIIYAGFGVMGYFIVNNNNEYQLYRQAYVYTANDETYPTDNPYVGKYTLDQLQTGMDFYRRNRDLTIIITSLWYVLNILEAYVDAHFFDYDISEDLSLRLAPTATPSLNPMVTSVNSVAPGLKISLKF